MVAEEREITIEVVCTRLPGSQWGDRGPVHLAIQKGEELVDTTPADLKRVVFRPDFKASREADGGADFTGPYAHGPRNERFIHLIWAVMDGDAAVAALGRIKISLGHITWQQVEKAAARGKPLKVGVALTNAQGKPVFGTVKADAAKWQL
jgi:uncharacterized protein DUF5990